MHARVGRALFLGIASALLAQCASIEQPRIEPVSLESGANTIRLSFLGRYAVGWFKIGGTKPAGYDPTSQLLFVVSSDRGWVDFVDISDPAAPRRVRRLILLGYGGFPESVDVSHGILAVALTNRVKTLPGRVLLFDTEGHRIGDFVKVGPHPVQLRFTSSGRELVVASQGAASEDYTIDPEGSISIIDLGIIDQRCRGAACEIRPRALQLDFAEFSDQRTALRAEGVRLYGPDASVAQDLEPEALAIAPDGRTAWVSLQRNNAIAVIDLVGRRIDDIFALGVKDHSRPRAGLDASDRDGETNIRPWPIYAFYAPDILATYQAQGQTYLVSANEGDVRDFDGFSEDARIGELRLDPEAFPNAATLQEDRNLGRLRVTRVDGDVDGDGAFDQIFALGTRSFAIWTGRGELVFDSGDDLEQIIDQAAPGCFNCSSGNIRFDSRSADRGPEPETLAIGRVGGRDYVFVAPERIGGLYVYDITDPAAPAFQQYINYRDFSVDPGRVCEENRPVSRRCAAAGDLEPEGVRFIAAADSPIGVPLVVVTHELSTTATIYRIDAVR